MKKNIKGFTLVELIVVIAIFSILFGSILAILNPTTDLFKQTERYENERVVAEGIEDAVALRLRNSRHTIVLNSIGTLPNKSDTVRLFRKTSGLEKEETLKEEKIVHNTEGLKVIVLDNTYVRPNGHKGYVYMYDNMEDMANDNKKVIIGDAFFNNYDFEFTANPSTDSVEIVTKEWGTKDKEYRVLCETNTTVDFINIGSSIKGTLETIAGGTNYNATLSGEATATDVVISNADSGTLGKIVFIYSTPYLGSEVSAALPGGGPAGGSGDGSGSGSSSGSDSSDSAATTTTTAASAAPAFTTTAATTEASTTAASTTVASGEEEKPEAPSLAEGLSIQMPANHGECPRLKNTTTSTLNGTCTVAVKYDRGNFNVNSVDVWGGAQKAGQPQVVGDTVYVTINANCTPGQEIYINIGTDLPWDNGRVHVVGATIS